MKKTLLVFLFLFHLFTLQAYDGSVVCLHGFFRSYKCMIPVANTLRNEGFDVYLWDYPCRHRTIEEHAENLVEVLKIIAKNRPSEPIHFVTHSLGGIIVRAAVNHPECPEEAKIGKAVLYAPPNHGSELARKFHGCPAIRWIFGKGAGSQLLTFTKNEMDALGNFPSTMDVLILAGQKRHRILSIWTDDPNDGKVTVNETRLSTPHKHKTLNASHTWIMRSRESIALTKEFLIPKTCNN